MSSRPLRLLPPMASLVFILSFGAARADSVLIKDFIPPDDDLYVCQLADGTVIDVTPDQLPETPAKGERDESLQVVSINVGGRPCLLGAEFVLLNKTASAASGCEGLYNGLKRTNPNTVADQHGIRGIEDACGD